MSQPSLLHNPSTEDEKIAWLKLSRTDNVGPVTFYKLVETYGSAAEALHILPELSKRGGRKKPLSAPSDTQIDRELNALHKMKGRIVTAACPEYSLALAATDDAPPVISVIGNADMMNRNCVAMVGSRNASLNGRKLAEKIAKGLGAEDYIVASGLARGIDTAAHQGALPTGTIAVVAGGIDVIYPEENTELYNRIKEQGLIVAESPMGQKPFAQSFPRRNRIVSGLSQGVVVVEANMRSGSLITARLAGEQGRDVMAVPGSPLDPRAQGPNHLLRDGATLVRDAKDIIETLSNFSGGVTNHGMKDFSIQESPIPFHPEEPSENAREKILAELSFTPLAVDELIRACELSVPAVQTVLLELELAGRLQRHAGNRVSLQGEKEI